MSPTITLESTPTALSTSESGPTASAAGPGGSALAFAMKRCSPVAVQAAFAFERNRDPSLIPTILCGLIERYIDGNLRGRLETGAPGLRLAEDLGIDSLTLMEIGLRAEDALGVPFDNEDLCRMKTLGDVLTYAASRASTPPAVRGPA